MKQENVISLYNALSAKVASAPTLDNAAYVRTYAILNTAKYASKEASVLSGAAEILRAGGQGARRIFNSTKRFNKEVFNAGKESARYGKRVYDTVNPSLSGTKRLGLGIGYGASDFGKSLKTAIKNNPRGAIATGVGLGGFGTGAGALAFGGGDDATPVKPTYDWQNDFIGALGKWIKDNPGLAALAVGGIGLGVGHMMS